MKYQIYFVDKPLIVYCKIFSFLKYSFLLLLIFQFSSCDHFKYSPYETTLADNQTDIINKNLQIIQDLNQSTLDSFKFALLSDSHRECDDFFDAVAHINSNSELIFVIHLGDLTHFGLKQEYQWAYDILSNLNTPYLTVIGNHEFLNNGEYIYQEMFGDFNYTFDFQTIKFIMFNTNNWETNSNSPNFDWLKNELIADNPAEYKFVLAHVPPFGDQFNSDQELQYKSLMAEYNTTFSIHGHKHSFSFEDHYNDGVKYLVVDNIGARNYCIITVSDSVQVDRIFY